jgi:hypothetical protein
MKDIDISSLSSLSLSLLSRDNNQTLPKVIVFSFSLFFSLYFYCGCYFFFFTVFAPSSLSLPRFYQTETNLN